MRGDRAPGLGGSRWSPCWEGNWVSLLGDRGRETQMPGRGRGSWPGCWFSPPGGVTDRPGLWGPSTFQGASWLCPVSPQGQSPPQGASLHTRPHPQPSLPPEGQPGGGAWSPGQMGRLRSPEKGAGSRARAAASLPAQCPRDRPSGVNRGLEQAPTAANRPARPRRSRGCRARARWLQGHRQAAEQGPRLLARPAAWLRKPRGEGACPGAAGGTGDGPPRPTWPPGLGPCLLGCCPSPSPGPSCVSRTVLDLGSPGGSHP